MTAWPLPDPSPEDDLPSDVSFGGFLESLTSAKVFSDLEAGFHGRERAILTYEQRKVLKSQTNPLTSH